MVLKKRDIYSSVGGRLQQVRKHFNYSKLEMAARLGVKGAAYYKNEYSENIPGLLSLYQLKKEFNISMDWLLFGRGEMIYKETDKADEEAKTAHQAKLAEELEKTKSELQKFTGLEKITPEIKELAKAMADDQELRYEMLLYFHKYQKTKTDRDGG